MKHTGLLITLAIVAAALVWGFKTYNKLVKMDEGVKASWSQVENV